MSCFRTFHHGTKLWIPNLGEEKLICFGDNIVFTVAQIDFFRGIPLASHAKISGDARYKKKAPAKIVRDITVSYISFYCKKQNSKENKKIRKKSKGGALKNQKIFDFHILITLEQERREKISNRV